MHIDYAPSEQASAWLSCWLGKGSSRLAAVTLVGLFATAAPRADAQQQGSDWLPMEIGTHTVSPGETSRVWFNIAKTVGGEARMLDTLVVVIRGARPGPTLCLTAAVHGDEWNGIEIAHRIYAGTPAAELAGTLIAMPVVNMQGVRNGIRYMPDRRDLNRSFPGSANGSLASRVAHSLFQGVIKHCDALIDLHTGSGSRANLPQIRTDLESPQALALSRSFGVGVVLAGRGPTGSLRGAVLDAGVPAVIYEAGGPLLFEEPEIALGVQGVRNVMADLGMISEDAKRTPSEVYRKTTWIRNDDIIGIYLPSSKLGDYVRKGDVLGTVTDPANENRQSIVATRDGRIIGMALPQFVLPGYGLFHIGYDPG